MNSLFLFWREAIANPLMTGAVGPSSPSVAKSMAAPLTRKKGPAKVLEVGPGTGAVTEAILEHLGPEDSLDLCELNPKFASWLRMKFGTPRSGWPTIRVLEGDFLQLAPGPYDFVISSVPCSNLQPDQVRSLLGGLVERVTADGTLSCLHYRGQGLRSRLAVGPERHRLRQVLTIISGFNRRHGVAKDTVWLSIPPAEIHYLRREPRPAAPAARPRQLFPWRR
ncbi:MAG: methyltransferase domain-containing protein [Candidatus Riflebacteria bacterium]|nr:methyltransferase domain-containing protein [Candidatus Riflebacteria bacterium]